MGSEPPPFLGTWYLHYVPCQIVREDVAVVDNSMEVFGSVVLL